MAKSNAFENALLLLIFNRVNISGIANASTDLNLYLSLHTADPGEAGTQATSEATYTGYNRLAVVRSALGWTVVGNIVSPASDIVFPVATAGAQTYGWAGVGTSATPGAAGLLVYRGAVNPPIIVNAGVTPKIKTGSQISES